MRENEIVSRTATREWAFVEVVSKFCCLAWTGVYGVRRAAFQNPGSLQLRSQVFSKRIVHIQ